MRFLLRMNERLLVRSHCWALRLGFFYAIEIIAIWTLRLRINRDSKPTWEDRIIADTTVLAEYDVTQERQSPQYLKVERVYSADS